MAIKIRAHELRVGDRIMAAGHPEVTKVHATCADAVSCCVTAFCDRADKIFTYAPMETLGVERQAA